MGPPYLWKEPPDFVKMHHKKRRKALLAPARKE